MKTKQKRKSVWYAVIEHRNSEDNTVERFMAYDEQDASEQALRMLRFGRTVGRVYPARAKKKR
jgi:hypothetical protein